MNARDKSPDHAEAARHYSALAQEAADLTALPIGCRVFYIGADSVQWTHGVIVEEPETWRGVHWHATPPPVAVRWNNRSGVAELNACAVRRADLLRFVEVPPIGVLIPITSGDAGTLSLIADGAEITPLRRTRLRDLAARALGAIR